MKATRHRPDFVLFFVIFLLVGFGLTMVYSASSIVAFREDGFPSSYFFWRQCLWALIGYTGLLAVMNFRTFPWQRFVIPGLLSSFLLLLAVYIPHAGPEVNGARRWIGIGSLSVQPSEYAILVIILYLSFFMTKNKDKMGDFKKGVLPPLIVAGVMFLLILKEPDLGTGLLLLGTTFCMLLAGGAPARYLFPMTAAAFPVIALLIASTPYRRARFTAFLHPFQDPSDTGYQLVQSLYAIGSGGWFGKGLGQSVEKFLYLPEPHTDFIFAVISEELGLVGAFFVVVLFILFIWRGIRVAQLVDDRFRSLIALGITSFIGVTAFVNIAGVTGLLPDTGVPLPFISYGGTSLMLKLFACGILLNISRYTRETQSGRPQPAKPSNVTVLRR
jgi:cell division protein FtsW